MTSTSSNRTIARLDAAHGTALLFRPLQKSKGLRPRLEVTQIFGERTFTWSLFEALDDTDQSVLLAVIFLLCRDQAVVPAHSENPHILALRSAVDPNGQAEALPMAGGRISLYEINQVLGWSGGGQTWVRVRSSLERLAKATVIVDTSDETYSCHLLGFRASEVAGRITVALNPALAAAVLGAGQYVNYRMDERQQLQTASARIAHTWLSTWLGPGCTNKIRLDRLGEHVYGPSTSPSVIRKRRPALKKLLTELKSIGWGINMDAKSVITIRRPKAVDPEVAISTPTLDSAPEHASAA